MVGRERTKASRGEDGIDERLMAAGRSGHVDDTGCDDDGLFFWRPPAHTWPRITVHEPLYYTALLVVQQGPVGSMGQAALQLELAISLHISVLGSPGGCGFISQPRSATPYRTFNIEPALADRAATLVGALDLPDKEPELSWNENLTGDAWTSITLFIEGCDMKGRTAGRTMHHQLIEPARYQGKDAGGYEQLLACLLEIAEARDSAAWHKVQRASMRPPPLIPGSNPGSR
jgi:hypothetical protein